MPQVAEIESANLYDIQKDTCKSVIRSLSPVLQVTASCYKILHESYYGIIPIFKPILDVCLPAKYFHLPSTLHRFEILAEIRSSCHLQTHIPPHLSRNNQVGTTTTSLHLPLTSVPTHEPCSSIPQNRWKQLHSRRGGGVGKARAMTMTMIVIMPL